MTFLLWGTSVFLPDSLDAIGKGEECVFWDFKAKTPVPVQSNASSVGDYSMVYALQSFVWSSPVCPAHSDLTAVNEKHW